MIDVRSLEREDGEGLYAAFMAAFADYSVPITMSREDFDEANRRRGFDPSISLGAYDGERLVGFIMNGKGTWRGVPSAYDLGTGVLPEARGSGLSGELATRLIQLLPGLGLRRYVLEVIRDNAAAYKTYLKAGFVVTRELECPGGIFVDPGKAEPTGVEIVELPGGASFPRAAAAAMRDWEPTWQNSDDSIARTPERLTILGANEKGTEALLGYIVSGSKGTVWQLAVSRNARRRGIGTALLREVARRLGPTMRYVNIQADDNATLGLLASCGIEESVGQYEMIRELGRA